MEKFNNDFTSISNIEKGITSLPIHPLYKFSLGLAMNAIMHQKHNRLIIYVPVYSDLMNWLTFFITLEMMKIEYRDISEEIFDFDIGEKLLFNNHIVEFQSYDPNRNVFWLKTKDGNTTYPADRGNDLQHISTDRPLATLKAVMNDYKKRPVNILDHLINVSTGGNHEHFQNTLLYVNTINDTNRFITKTRIAEEQVSNIFLWGKLGSDGTIKQLANTRFTHAKASCVLVPKTYYIEDLIERKTHSIHAVLINNINDCKNELQDIESLIDNDIPIIIGANPDNLKDLELFTELDFQIWNWSKTLTEKTLDSETKYFSGLKKIDSELKRFVDKKISPVDCTDPVLEDLVIKFLYLKSKLPLKENEKLHQQYYRTYGFYLKLVRLIMDIDENLQSQYANECNNVFKKFDDYSLYITKENVELINELKNSTINYINSANKNYKAEVFHDIVEPGYLSLKKTGVIIGRNDEIDLHSIYWYNFLTGDKSQIRAKKNYKRISSDFLTLSEYLSNEDLSFDTVIICGWLGAEKMNSLFNNNKVTDLKILLYPFEKKWYQSALKKWKEKQNIQSDNSIWADILSIDKTKLDIFQKDDEIIEIVKTKSGELDIIDFEFHGRKAIYRKYESRDMDESELARTVLFNHDYYSLITDNHKLDVVTEFFRNMNNPESITVSLDKIKTGDYIAFSTTGRDYLKEYAEKGLINAGKKEIIDKSQLWWKTLVEYMNDNDFDSTKMYAHLHMKGFERNIATLRNWINGYIIFPDNINDIKIISDTIGSNMLSENINSMKEAADIVLSARMQASSHMRTMMKSKLPSILENHNFDSKLMKFQLEDFGEIMILRVEEIDNDKVRISRNEINKLLREE